MIVRIRILRHGKEAHEWSVFIVDEAKRLDEIFGLIKTGKLIFLFLQLQLRLIKNMSN